MPLGNDIRKVFETYIPLVEKLYGRKWLLEPNPLNLPYGCAGNIFKGEKGDIIITLVSQGKSILEQKGIQKNLKLYVKFKGASKFKNGYSFGTHYSGRKKVKILRKERGLELTVAEHSSATVIILR